MSDFIERVAARAVGASPIARPRLSALFEEPGEAVGHPLEMAHEEIDAPPMPATPSADTARSADTAPSPHDPPRPIQDVAAPGRAEDAAPAREPKGPEPLTAAAHEPEPAPAEREPDQRPVVSSAPAGPRAAAMTPLRDDAPDQREIEVASPIRLGPGIPTPPGEPDRVAAVVRPAVAASSDVESAASGPAMAPRASEEPAPVRVHIGRLEVRANLNEAPRQQPRREIQEAERLSLADYLRGKREVGL